jgi:hypothetical protein
VSRSGSAYGVLRRSAGAGRGIADMLWSQDPEEPSQESRAAQVTPRRGGRLFALLLPAALPVVVVRRP